MRFTLKGYFNYYLLEDPKTLKSYVFFNLPEPRVTQLFNQFNNGKHYIYIGCNVLMDKEGTYEYKIHHAAREIS